MIKRISRTKRIKEVKDLLSEVGMNFREDKDWNTFQVWPDGDKRGGSSTYDTLGTSDSDLEDALGTGLDMAKRIKKANPRCRTFQVKRKIGKKTIQVRRKVCNPTTPMLDLDNTIIKKQLDNLVGKSVKVYYGNITKGILRKISETDYSYKVSNLKFNTFLTEKIVDNMIFLNDGY